MKRGMLVLVIVIVTAVFFLISQNIRFYRDVILVDFIPNGGWQAEKDFGKIVSDLKPTDKKSQPVIVLLSSDYLETKTGYGIGDQEPIYYSQISSWFNIPVLKIFVNWERWRQADPVMRDKGISLYIPMNLRQIWLAENYQSPEYSRIFKGEIVPLKIKATK